MAIPPTYSQNLTTFISSTLDERSKEIISQIWRSTDMLAWASSHRRPQQGGKKVFIPVEYGKNSSIKKGLGRGSTIDLTRDEIITECWYDWQTYGGGVIRYRDDDLENSSKYAIFNLLQAHENNMIMSFKETIEEDLFSANTGATEGFAGLQHLIEDADVDATKGETLTTGVGTWTKTVGNIDRTEAPWWGNWGRNMTGLDPSVWLTYYMREAADNVTMYSGKGPEVILTHYTVKNFYEDEVGDTLRTTDVQLGDIGIKAVEWKGIPFITSPYAPQDKMYFVGNDALELIYEPRMWFKSTPWKEPINQPFEFARQTLAKGQFIIKRPRSTSVIYNINS